MKYLSLFSGIGGFELGIQQAYEEKIRFLRQPSGNTTDDKPNLAIGEQYDRESPSRNGAENPTCIGYSEIDKYAIQVYERHFPYKECENCRLERNRQEDIRLSGGQEAVNGTGTDLSQTERPDGRIINSTRSQGCTCEHKNYGDITQINADELPDFDLICGGFPCQSFSIAGKRRGFDDTRGTLFFDIARILKEKHPRLLLLENVKGLLSHDNGLTFKTIIATLDELGYDLQWQVLNSKNFGVPQNRERVFIIGHLRGTARPQVFPIGEGNPNDIDQLNQPTHSNDRVYGIEGIAPTLNTMQGGRRQPKVAPTMRANHHNTADIHFIPQDSKIRRLTPTECERLQGFPDGWTEGISDSQRYKCLGNAVTVNVIKEIASRL